MTDRQKRFCTEYLKDCLLYTSQMQYGNRVHHPKNSNDSMQDTSPKPKLTHPSLRKRYEQQSRQDNIPSQNPVQRLYFLSIDTFFHHVSIPKPSFGGV